MIYFNRIGGGGANRGNGPLFHRHASRFGTFHLPTPVDLPRMRQDFAFQMQQLPETRRQLIFRIRRQIAEGSYDDSRKFEIAFDRMLDRVIAEEYGAGDN
jgi:hypothetical protein